MGGNPSIQRETAHASERIIKLHAEKPEASFQTQDFLAAICDSPANKGFRCAALLDIVKSKYAFQWLDQSCGGETGYVSGHK